MMGNDLKAPKDTGSALLPHSRTAHWDCCSHRSGAKTLWTLPSEVEPTHSAVSAFLCLCFSLPSTLTLPLFIYLFLFSGGFYSVMCLPLCHDWGLSPLPRVTPSVSAPACSTFYILSPGNDPLRFCAHLPVQNGPVWQASPAWYPTEAAGSLPSRLSTKAVGSRLISGPGAYSNSCLWMDSVDALSGSMMHHLHRGKTFGRDSPGEGRESGAVKWSKRCRKRRDLCLDRKWQDRVAGGQEEARKS